MKYYLRDRNPEIVHWWKKYFEGCGDVEASCGDIFELGEKVGALVSPANAFGFMDGGIDYVYSMRFGWQLQERLQAHLQQHHDGELAVGEAVIIPTNETVSDNHLTQWKTIPYLISAPTMRVPGDVRGTVNAYLSFRAVIRVVKDWNRRLLSGYEYGHEVPETIDSVLCPGMGTMIGKMEPKIAAFQMFQAYKNCHMGIKYSFNDLGAAWTMHEMMASGKNLQG